MSGGEVMASQVRKCSGKNCIKLGKSKSHNMALGKSHKFISRKEEFETHYVVVILVYHSVARPVLLLKKCKSFRFERFPWADKGP